MGNFLISVSSTGQEDLARNRFGRVLAALCKFKVQTVHQVVEGPLAQCATLTRENGSAACIGSDIATGAWLCASGTWFHTDGYGPGHEPRLLARFLEIGPERLGSELEGFFVIAISDPRTGDFFVLTDVMGSCHVFERAWPGQILLSSSSLALAALGGASLDAVGCQEFLQTGISYEDRTLFSEVHKLQSASVYRFRDGALLSLERYWRPEDLSSESLSGEIAVHQLWETLSGAAVKIARTFPRPVCDLTGGYDSRAVLAGFLGAGVSVFTAVSGSSEKPDVQISKALSASLGIAHTHLLLKTHVNFDAIREAHALTDGEFDPVEYTQILWVQRSLSKQFGISLNGSYGGIARGLWWELLFPHVGTRRPLDARRLAERRYMPPYCNAELFRPDLRIDLAEHLSGVVARSIRGLQKHPNTLQMDVANLSMRIQRWQGRIASSTHQIWPCLSPFGLRSVLEVVLQTDAQSRLRSKLIRRMLAAYQPRLADFVLDRGYPAAPVSLGNFHRFAPVIGHFAGRVISKVRRSVLGRSIAQASEKDVPPRLQLWQDESVRALFSVRPLRSEGLLEPRVLQTFLQGSRERNFAWPEQWNRILSLEHTLELLAREGASPRTP